MIFLFFLINLINTESQAKIDSLRNLITENPQLNLLLELNNLYRITDKLDSGIVVLKEYEKDSKLEEKPFLIYTIGDNYFFMGKILDARNYYLQTVARFSKSEIANDALERLHLIEMAREDTTLLKRLTKLICLYETAQLKIAEDSLKNFLRTGVGEYAYYYLGLVYYAQGKLPEALSALDELNRNFPEHKIHKSALFTAEINLKLNNKKEAQKILEDLIIKEPTSIYAVRAREMLKGIIP